MHDNDTMKLTINDSNIKERSRKWNYIANGRKTKEKKEGCHRIASITAGYYLQLYKHV